MKDRQGSETAIRYRVNWPKEQENKEWQGNDVPSMGNEQKTKMRGNADKKSTLLSYPTVCRRETMFILMDQIPDKEAAKTDDSELTKIQGLHKGSRSFLKALRVCI